MTKILEKIESEVICIIDDKQYQYTNGKEAYQQLTNNYSITSIKAFNNQIIINLNPKENNKEQYWQEVYKKQFGEEPSFFRESENESINYRSRWTWEMLSRYS